MKSIARAIVVVAVVVAPLSAHHTAVYIMRRNGMEQDFLKAGDVVALTVCLAKDGSHKGGLEAIELPSGTKRVGECVIPR